jgi:hypothetical protein
MNGATGELGLNAQMTTASPISTTIIGISHQSFRFFRKSRNSDKKLIVYRGAGQPFSSAQAPPSYFERVALSPTSFRDNFILGDYEARDKRKD